jgi:metal-dependent hydrolase (beta-lactamase superfamily II)
MLPPRIEKIVEAAAQIEPKIYAVAAGHCPGQFAFAELIRIYGTNFELAGVGSVISLPS